MKKILSTLFLALLAVGSAVAQGMVFESEGTTLEQASAKAKAEGKLIFLDCFTTWCGPCKKMARDVFTQKEVGDAMNGKFVNLKIDMESAYGAPLAKRLEITAYPTFVIFNSDAQEIGRFVGGSDAQGFIARVNEKSTDLGSSELEKRWTNGDRDPQFLRQYLQSLNATYKSGQANLVADAILAGKEATFASDPELRQIFLRNINDPTSPSFIQTAKQPQPLIDVIGTQAVEGKLQSVWTAYQRQLVVENDGTASLDQEKFDRYISLLNECKVPDADHYRLTTLITLAGKQADWTNYMKYIREYLANPALDANDMMLAGWVKPFATPTADAASKAEMAKLLRARIAEIDAGKRESMRKVGNMTLSVPTRDLLDRLAGVLEGQPIHP